ncbi:MAG: T9SS type A sorting domain-containing protein [Ignavibacteria bacterium]|nr:T9SS type A sorting domain-containing protein [Ignavibacteria bacterium]
MKKVYLSLFIILFIFADIYSQYGNQKIYSDDTSGKGIFKMNSIKMSSTGLNQIYIQRGVSFPDGNPNTSGQYLKFNRQNGSWYVPLNGFANANWCFCTCPFFCNPPRFVCNRVLIFVPSPVDTQYAIKNLMGSCGCDAGDIVFYTVKNGTNSIDLPQFSNGFLGQLCFGIDIDPVNDAVAYIGYPIIGTSYKVIYKTTNRGGSWNPVDTNANFSSYIKINPLKRTNVFCRSFSQMLLSTNSGADFFPVGGQGFTDMKFCYSDSTIYGMTYSGVYKSTNHGFNWTQVSNFGSLRCIEVSPENSNIVYAGNSSGLYRSSNGGINFVLYNDHFLPSRNVLGISKDVSSGDTVIVATSDAVYKVWGSYVGLSNISNEVPERFLLSQNYPNPFNPVTKIKFQIPLLRGLNAEGGRGVFTNLTIYDALGKEVAVLLNQQLQPGTYEADWDASNYPSGVYYYQISIHSDKLKTENYSVTKKMVLIK